MHIYHHHTVHLCNCSHAGHAARSSDSSPSAAPRTPRPFLGGLLELARLAAVFALSAANERATDSRGADDSTVLDSPAAKPAVTRDESVNSDAADASGQNAILALFSQAANGAEIDLKNKPGQVKPPLSLMDAFLAAFRDDPALA